VTNRPKAAGQDERVGSYPWETRAYDP
jgi:hypothetical protein